MLQCYIAEISLVEDTQTFEFWLEKVNSQRREKVLHCKNEKDKQRSLVAGMLLRHALEQEGISYEDAVFSKTKEGKPFLESHENLHFSISHAGEYAVCVISDTAVGVDIECMDKSAFQDGKEKRLQAMAKRCFSETEWKCFEQAEDKPKLFLEYWTKKEAYSKAVGKGLGMDFSGIDTERERKSYWSEWLHKGYCISIYSNLISMCIKKIEYVFDIK